MRVALPAVFVTFASGSINGAFSRAIQLHGLVSLAWPVVMSSHQQSITRWFFKAMQKLFRSSCARL